MRLSERVALVTGGSRGIGRAVALAFAREGARVAVVAVSDGAALTEVTRDLAAAGADALALRADVTRSADVDQAIRQVVERWGHIDILVNNAGVLHPSRLEEIGDAQWQTTLAVHLTGTFHCTRAAVPLMKAQGGGKIINVAAPAGLRGAVGVADYGAAKGGIIAFTRNAAIELKTHNIQVNCVSPVAETRMTEALVAFRRDALREPAAASGEAARPGPEAVAPAFVFFACADSDHITGQVLAVDGGLTV